MGLSASQARYLCLVAKQTDLEYQGQQINQERTVLSQQATALYNSLLTIDVPTPPSTSDYTTVKYTGAEGATSFTIGQITPSGTTYSVDLQYTKTGHFMEESGTAAATLPLETVKLLEVTNPKTETETFGNGYTLAELTSSYYVIDANDEANTIDASNVDQYFTKLSDGTYALQDNGSYKLGQVTTNAGARDYNVNNSGDYVGLVAGSPCYTLQGALDNGGISETTIDSYIEAIRDAFPDYADKSDNEIMQEFSVYFTMDPETRKNVPHFVFTQETTTAFRDTNNTHYVTTYDYIANGKYTDVQNKKECLLTFDAAGRISEIKIPSGYNADGSPKTYKTVKLEAETVTDTNAYNDAYAKYEYAQYEYDKKQQEINAKTEVIQKEDKNLELKLQRLDNERTMITTEIEALEKVINDNIEASYKTFSG